MCFTEYKVVKIDSEGVNLVVHDLTEAELDEFEAQNAKHAQDWTTPIKQSNWWKTCSRIIKMLLRDRDAGPFKQPVDPEALKIPDYFTYIKHPMDLGTIEKKLNACEYKNPMEFVNDVRTVFRNCYIYNSQKSVVLLQAEELSRKFEEQLAQLASLPESLIRSVPAVGRT